MTSMQRTWGWLVLHLSPWLLKHWNDGSHLHYNVYPIASQTTLHRGLSRSEATRDLLQQFFLYKFMAV